MTRPGGFLCDRGGWDGKVPNEWAARSVGGRARGGGLAPRDRGLGHRLGPAGQSFVRRQAHRIAGQRVSGSEAPAPRPPTSRAGYRFKDVAAPAGGDADHRAPSQPAMLNNVGHTR